MLSDCWLLFTNSNYILHVYIPLVNFPAECTETDDDGCTYYYTYVNKENVTIVHVVGNKGWYILSCKCLLAKLMVNNGQTPCLEPGSCRSKVH